MTTQEALNYLNNSLPQLLERKITAEEHLSSLLTKKLNEIKPLIEFMKKNNIYFRNPLIDYARTIHGVILGQSDKYPQEIIVYDPKWGTRVVFVSKDTDESTEPMFTINDYLKRCDYKKAWAGIKYVTDFDVTWLRSIVHDVTDKELFIKDMES